MKHLKCDYCGQKKVKATTYNQTRVLAKLPNYCSVKCRKADKPSITATCGTCKKKFTAYKRLTEITLAVRTGEPIVCQSCLTPPVKFKCSGCGKKKVATDPKRKTYMNARIRQGKTTNCRDCSHTKDGGISTAQLLELARSLGFKLKAVRKKKGGPVTPKWALHRGVKVIMESNGYIVKQYLWGYKAGLNAAKKPKRRVKLRRVTAKKKTQRRVASG